MSVKRQRGEIGLSKMEADVLLERLGLKIFSLVFIQSLKPRF